MPSPSRGALLLIDIQYDFLTGSLAVPSGVNILTPVYRLMDAGSWDLVIASQGTVVFSPLNLPFSL